MAILHSPLDRATFGPLGEEARRHVPALSSSQRQSLTNTVWADVFSEYDARFLQAWLETCDLELTPAFRACVRHWAADEELHYLGFRAIYAPLVGRSEAQVEASLEQRASKVRFDPLSELLEDELSIACLFAYDELATVRAYLAARENYALLGPGVARFARTVTADEGRHFRNFLKLLRQEHADRLDEIPQRVARIRAHEGLPYANTFVLDHDDEVWTDRLFDEAAELLCRHLAS